MELTALDRVLIDHLTFLCSMTCNFFFVGFFLCSLKQMKVVHRFSFAVSAISIPIYRIIYRKNASILRNRNYLPRFYRGLNAGTKFFVPISVFFWMDKRKVLLIYSTLKMFPITSSFSLCDYLINPAHCVSKLPKPTVNYMTLLRTDNSITLLNSWRTLCIYYYY